MSGIISGYGPKNISTREREPKINLSFASKLPKADLKDPLGMKPDKSGTNYSKNRSRNEGSCNAHTNQAYSSKHSRTSPPLTATLLNVCLASLPQTASSA